MTVKIGKKSFKSVNEAIASVKKTRPDVKDPAAYVNDTLKLIEQRRAAKQKRLNDAKD